MACGPVGAVSGHAMASTSGPARSTAEVVHSEMSLWSTSSEKSILTGGWLWSTVATIICTPFIGGLYYGIAFRKEDKAFRDLIADTVDGLIKDGTYKKTLEKWELTAIGVGQLTINTQPR